MKSKEYKYTIQNMQNKKICHSTKKVTKKVNNKESDCQQPGPALEFVWSCITKC